MSNKELKVKYKELFNLVKVIVNNWDPMGLLASTAPDDEYEMEIGSIITLINKVDSVTDLAEGIAIIFTEAFDCRFSETECLSNAQRIWDELKK